MRNLAVALVSAFGVPDFEWQPISGADVGTDDVQAPVGVREDLARTVVVAVASGHLQRALGVQWIGSGRDDSQAEVVPAGADDEADERLVLGEVAAELYSVTAERHHARCRVPRIEVIDDPPHVGTYLT